MTGDFRITLEYLKEIGACQEGQREFARVFPDGAGYQETLDRCAEEGRIDFGKWLLNKVGRTDDVRTYDEDINDPGKIIIFAGKLEFKFGVFAKLIKAGLGIEAGCGIEAGWGIEAGEGIKAGRGIEAGLGIEAGWGIEAGEGIKAGRGIEAGLGIEAGEGIKAGRGIKAGCGIKAGRGIKAGWGIEAGEGIKAGSDYGIFAGLCVKVTLWAQHAIVSAKEKPANLISGFWKPKEGTE